MDSSEPPIPPTDTSSTTTIEDLWNLLQEQQEQYRFACERVENAQRRRDELLQEQKQQEAEMNDLTRSERNIVLERAKFERQLADVRAECRIRERTIQDDLCEKLNRAKVAYQSQRDALNKKRSVQLRFPCRLCFAESENH